MKIQSKIVEEIIFNEEEIKMIKLCVQYAVHRITEHVSGISKCVNHEKLIAFNKELNKKN